MSNFLSFDPRTVPIGRIDHGLPAVPCAHLSPNALKDRFARPPVWQPEVEQETPPSSTRPPIQAAVLVPIVLRGANFSQPSVLLTQRADHLSTHSGQIAFPGGKVEPQDENHRATALRETQEEVGLHSQHIEIIGELPVYTTSTAFRITPVIGLVSPGFVLQPNVHEVQDVFEVPLDFLMNPGHHRHHAFEWQGSTRQWFSMPYQEQRTLADGQSRIVERFIWGATAALLRNLYRFLVVTPAR